MLGTFLLTDVIGNLLPLAGDGVLDLANRKLGEFHQTLLLAGGMFAVVFVLMQAISGKGSVARIVVAGIAAAVFLFIIHNTDFLRKQVDNELNSAPSPLFVEDDHPVTGDHS